MSESVRLENWRVISLGGGPNKAPEAQSLCLHGKVYGHPNFADGTEITTSAILGVSPENGLNVCTYSRIYRLGEVDPEYVAYRKSIGLEFDPARPVVLKA